jgi:hypothetical protein
MADDSEKTLWDVLRPAAIMLKVAVENAAQNDVSKVRCEVLEAAACMRRAARAVLCGDIARAVCVTLWTVGVVRKYRDAGKGGE